jgi:hypothetical protein
LFFWVTVVVRASDSGYHDWNGERVTAGARGHVKSFLFSVLVLNGFRNVGKSPTAEQQSKKDSFVLVPRSTQPASEKSNRKSNSSSSSSERNTKQTHRLSTQRAASCCFPTKTTIPELE